DGSEHVRDGNERPNVVYGFWNRDGCSKQDALVGKPDGRVRLAVDILQMQQLESPFSQIESRLVLIFNVRRDQTISLDRLAHLRRLAAESARPIRVRGLSHRVGG